MGWYLFEAQTLTGERIRGCAQSAGADAVALGLQEQGYLVLRVTPALPLGGPARPAPAERAPRGAPPVLWWAVLFRQLGTMIETGLSVAKSLEVLLSSEQQPARRRLLAYVRTRLLAGDALGAILKRLEGRLPAGVAATVAAGEAGGRLAQVLLRLAGRLEQEHTLVAKVRTALTYPALVAVFGAGVATLIAVFVVPTIVESLFSEGQELPWVTRLVLGASTHLRSHGSLYLVGLAALTLALQAIRRNPRCRPYWDGFLLRLPWLGPAQHHLALSILAENLAMLLRVGVPLIEALPVAGSSLPNHAGGRAIAEVAAALEKGGSLASAMGSRRFFPPLMNALALAGQESGRLDEVLESLGAHYRGEAERSLETMTRMIEPVLTLVLAVFVGGLLLAVYLPIFESYESIRAF